MQHLPKIQAQSSITAVSSVLVICLHRLPAITGPLIYKDSVSSLKTAAKEKSCDDSTNLIIAVHHFQSPTRLLFLHMPQGTLQAEDNIFVLLYNLPKYKQVGEMQWAPSWSRVMDTVFSFVMYHYTYISL